MTATVPARRAALAIRPLPLLLLLPAVLSLGALLGAAGCGGAAPKSAEPAAEPLPADADGTLAVLDRAEAELAGALDKYDTSGKKAEPASPPAPPGDAVTAEKEAKPEATELGVSQPDPCATACRALGSMRRAVEHLCGLTGQEDQRCDTARGRVARAEERVRSSCPSC